MLANLANFAYDPKNMEYLRELQVADLFLDMLTEENENFVEFGMGELLIHIITNLPLTTLHCISLLLFLHNQTIRVSLRFLVCMLFSGGLCNLSMDPECRDIILQSGGIALVTNRLASRREEIILSAITTLMNLTTPSSRSEITDPAILQCMLRFSLSESPRLRNLAAVFLQDCCSKEQVAQAEQQMQGQQQTAVGIPLPKD